MSNFTLYIKFRKNSFKYCNYNMFYYSSENVWDSFDYNDSDWPRSMLVMNQARSPMGSIYADSAIVLAYMKFSDVEQWAGTTIGNRGQAYLDFKKYKAEKLLKQLEKAFPGINNSIESYYTSSPLTYRDYTATTEGSMFGILRDCSISSQLLVSQKTKIPNLFFTGQNINAHGMLGVAVSSIMTTSEILGMHNIIKELKKC